MMRIAVKLAVKLIKTEKVHRLKSGLDKVQEVRVQSS